MKLLIVEDEEKLAKLLVRGLREEGHQVDHCSSGSDAREQARVLGYDVVVLDWMLPDTDGLEILRAWRRDGLRTPVLMLTARGQTAERIAGLRAGADDYLAKPFDFDELLARIEALHRRSQGAGESWRVGEVNLDAKRRMFTSPSGEVPLSAREFALAAELFAHAGDVVTRARLVSAVWGHSFEGDPNILDVYVGYLRVKLLKVANAGHSSTAIRAVRGVGFRVSLESDPSE